MLAGSEIERDASGPSYGIYAYTAREWDPEINLYYYRARYYDPEIGRFISEDPARYDGGVNFYAYVSNAPTNFRDPKGLWAAGVGPGVAGVAALPPPLTGIGGEANCMLVFDGDKNFGILCCGAAGPQWGGALGATGGAAGVFCPSCESVCDLPGLFFQVSGSGGAGPGGFAAGGSMSGRNVSAVGFAGGGVEGGAAAGVLVGDCVWLKEPEACKCE
jgi:RHS repeat-associated protein